MLVIPISSESAWDSLTGLEGHRALGYELHNRLVVFLCGDLQLYLVDDSDYLDRLFAIFAQVVQAAEQRVQRFLHHLRLAGDELVW